MNSTESQAAVDSHFHVWQLARGDYGWLTPELKPIFRDVTVEEWRAESKPFGMAAGVLVQAAPTEAETYFLLMQADAHPEVLGVVGWVDLLVPDAPARMAALARHPKLKGLRPMLHDIDDPAWILQPALGPALQAMADAGLVFNALIRPVHLPHILALAARHPDLRLVIDHAAKPDIAGGHWQPWADGLEAIARQTQATCKLSGLLTEAGPSPAPGVTQRWAAHVLASFGPSRVLWGSDWPVLERAGTCEGWWLETQQALSAFSEPERAAILGGNARRVYRL